MKGLTAKQQASLIVAKNMNKADAVRALVKAEVNNETKLEILRSAGLVAAKKSDITATVAQTTANSKLLVSIKATTVGLLAQAAAWLATPMGMATATVAVITGIITVINLADKAIERQTEKVKEATTAYKSAQSELDGINSELETTAKRIDELNDKPSLTFAEESELQKLKDITAELLIQQGIEERKRDESAVKVGKESAKLYKKQYGNKQFSEQQVEEHYQSNAYTAGLTSDIYDISPSLAGYKKLNDLLVTAKSELDELKAAGADTRWAEENVNSLTATLKNLKTDIFTNVESLNNFIKSVELVPEDLRVDVFGDDWQANLDNAKNGIYLIYDYLDKAAGKEIKFAEISNQEQFSEVKKQLEDLGAQSPVTAELLNNTQYSGLISALESAGFSIDDIVNQLNRVPENKEISLKLDLTDISDNLETFNEDISKVYSSMDLLDAAADEFSTSGAITAGTFKSLSDNNLLQYLQFTSDGLVILTGDLLNSEQAIKQKAQADLAAALYADLLNIATRNLSDAEFLAQQQAENAGNAAQIMGDKFAKAAGGILTAAEATNLYNSISGAKGFDFKEQEQQVAQVIGKYNSAVTAINNMRSSTDSASNSFNRMASSAKSAANDIKQAMSQAKSDIQNLQSMTIAMLRKGYELQKKGIQDSIKDLQDKGKIDKELQEDAAKAQKKYNDDAKKALEEQHKVQLQIYEDQKKAVEDEFDAYRNKIELQLKLLKLKEEEHDYARELADKQKDVGAIENELLKLKYDDSVEAQKKRLELEAQLAEKTDDLNEFQHDKEVSRQEQALQDELDRFNQIHDNKIAIIDREKEAYEASYQYQIDALANQAELDEANHQIKLSQIEAETNSAIEAKQAELDAIDEFLSNEAGLRDEANALIESKDKDLLNRLIEYNRLYGITDSSPLGTVMCLENYTYMQVTPKALHHNIREITI